MRSIPLTCLKCKTVFHTSPSLSSRKFCCRDCYLAYDKTILQKKHGVRKYPEGFGAGSRLYRIWCHIHSRCYNPNVLQYSDYGGRGITMCDQWRTDYNAFLKWSLVSGYAPNLSIDRIDNFGNYYPENCRWATMIEQANNKRNNTLITAWGETKSASAWARDKRCAVSLTMICRRLNMGFTPERAISTVGKGRQTVFRTLTAWGETKTLTEWVKDPRCVVERKTLKDRYSRNCDGVWAITTHSAKSAR